MLGVIMAIERAVTRSGDENQEADTRNRVGVGVRRMRMVTGNTVTRFSSLNQTSWQNSGEECSHPYKTW